MSRPSQDAGAAHAAGPAELVVPPMMDRLVFLIGPPRSGSTLLMRVLNATSLIHSRSEPHLMGPLAHLGFYENVDRAAFDHLQAADGVRGFVADLPGGEADYLDALRAYADTLYGRMLAAAPGNPRYFLDKTPANALILPFLGKLYPRAKFVVLTRHPAAIFASFAESFFDGDYAAAAAFNPILTRYVPAMARFLRQTHVPFVHVRYEDLVTDAEGTLQRISTYLDIPYEPGALDYKKQEVAGKGLGDPVGVKKHDRPVSSSKDTWGAEFAANRDRYEVVARQIAMIDPADLATFGYPIDTFWKPMEDADPASWKPRKIELDRFQRQRVALRWLRRAAKDSALGGALRKVRFACDVVLREGFAAYAEAEVARPRSLTED
jgi:hypothetical protein